ncbi:MAG: SufS family cysteine desulfurase [Bacteroidales bacterium]|nr:SufS family cysteine desulfurase [Bacteroidales bacterium]MDD2263403.1 SufS family cysteine desulfurase [Bacteroidales bacterium]MDD2830807.1 SufS family cysteine desulfurase [Bacteroidales bacterium]MDD3208006.1 SufS family cysteine desulfurase [Bacteroidales bacterium]MDD3696487.1 SufS family cysteine desulfurase [Bacteroidales bacterium]
MNIMHIREQFPALHQKVYGKPLVYLDNGATSQKPKMVLDVLQEMEGKLNGNVHRAVHYLSMQCTERYEKARVVIRDFINAASENEIIFTSGTTASLNLLAYSFGQTYVRPGDRIIVTEAEHHSNIVPWQMMCQRTGALLEVWEIDDTGALDPKKLEQILDKPGEVPRLLAITHVSNVLGIVNPLSEIIRIAHYYNVPVAVDGAQGIVHKKVDIREMDADFYAFSGHKLYGPTGTGVLYGKEKYLEEMVPWQGGGDMIETVSLRKGTTYAQLPLKFEAGTANFTGVAGLKAAVEFVNSLDAKAIEEHERKVTLKALEALGQIDGCRILGMPGTYYGQIYEKIPVFSMIIEGAHPADMATLLDKMGIAVRSGMLCAEPLLERFRVTSVLRASFALYNTLDELDFFVESLKKVLKMLR